MYVMVFLYMLCGIFYTTLGIITFIKNRKKPLNQTFLAICLVLSYWSFCLAFMTVTNDSTIATHYRVASTISWSSLYALVLLFIIILTEDSIQMKSPVYYIGLFFPSLISIYLYMFDPVTEGDLVKIPVGWAFINPVDKGLMWDTFFNVYYMSYMLIVFLLLIRWYRTTKVKRQLKQARIILYTLILTFALGTIVDIVLPARGVALMPPLTVFIVLSVISGMSYAMIKYDLMTLSKEKIVADVFEVMNEGLIIIDHLYKINAINDGALNMLNYTESDLLYQSVHLLFKDEGVVNSFGDSTSTEVEIRMHDEDTLPILASWSTLLDNFGDTLGYLLMFQDLSSYRKIQTKLELAYEDMEQKVLDRTTELVQVNAQLGTEIQMRIQKEKEIEHLAYNDQLTNLPNRRYFNNQVEKSIMRSLISSNQLAILFLDLDGFKAINDTLGHDQGDQLLKKVASRLTRLFRRVDLVARLGGDEFTVLINDVEAFEDVRRVCNNILEAFTKPFELGIGDYYITTSIGVAVYPKDGDNLETLMKNADISMYRAKEAGKGKFLFYKEDMLENLDRTLILTNDLHKAIECNQMEVYYQPQICASTEEIIGLEALLRWNHPVFGWVNPKLLIPIAERTGLIVEIGDWVLNRACEDFIKLKQIDERLTSMAVNLSANQIVSHSIVTQVEKAINNCGMNSKELELEITENILLGDTDYIFRVLNELKKINIRLAVDDFGTDYSSLSYLKNLPIDRIKIAKNFIDGIGSNLTDESIVAAVIVLGKKLNLSLIAEGVENQEQLDFLKGLGCDEIQGFYFHKPMTFEAIEMLLKRRNHSQQINKRTSKDSAPSGVSYD